MPTLKHSPQPTALQLQSHRPHPWVLWLQGQSLWVLAPSWSTPPSPADGTSCRWDPGHIPGAPTRHRPQWSLPPASSRDGLCPPAGHTCGTPAASLTCGLQEVPHASVHRGDAAAQCVGASRAERAGSGGERGEGHQASWATPRVSSEHPGAHIPPECRGADLTLAGLGTEVTHLPRRLSTPPPPPPAAPACVGHCPSPVQGQHQ